MKRNIKIWAIGLALSISSASVIAKPTAKPAAEADAGCAVLLPAAINAGQPFSVKVVRVPSYPGGWSRPTVIIDASYPTTAGNEIVDSREQTILRHNVTYALASFTVPEAFDLNTSQAIIASGKTANITATVKEPINKNKFRETTCAATAVVY